MCAFQLVFPKDKSKTEVNKIDITNSDDFLFEVSKIDSSIPYYNYTVSLFRHGLAPDWSKAPPNSTGGHFRISFPTNIQAFRSFVFLAVDFLNTKRKAIPFSENIEGLLVNIKKIDFTIQVWVNDGFSGSKIAQRYAFFNTWLNNTVSSDKTAQIEFHAHPTYRTYHTTSKDAKALAGKIRTFQDCIKDVVGAKDSNHKESASNNKELAVFNYKVAILHKRSRVERRMNPSYIDSIDTSKL
ncbi:hypothetical protein TRFO_35991 [Tritrichomonas foetus]|uniref:Uncharacterized protein n=1 Tax=Tritrichomonas foetus TaxID=1144522 RepID=A0A1J4JEX1_9EUKA|nr:hypothetical protein TRFO_35991 [Tritrichomonas foetus]|eukprot:OHS97742.1 hypothetical protein TRFO_35991 [Tritrichomonas foetus]